MWLEPEVKELRDGEGEETGGYVVEELLRRVDNWDAYIDYQISREPR